AEDMYTPSVFKNSSVCAARTHPCGRARESMNRFVPSVLRSCAMHLASAAFITSSCEDALHITDPRCPSHSRTSKLARFLPTRAARRTLFKLRSEINYFLMLAQKHFARTRVMRGA